MAEGESNIKTVQAQEGFQNLFVRSNVDVVFGGGNLGGGKEQPIYSKVLTPFGWKQIKDLKIGDKICTPFNGYSTIDGIYPQGVKDVYEIETTDGRKCKCGLEHLWSLRTKKQNYKIGKEKSSRHTTLMTTKDAIDALNNNKVLYIPTPKAIEFNEKEYVVSPYVLGILLGDGYIVNEGMSKTHFSISNTEQDIIKKVFDSVGGTRIKERLTNVTKHIFCASSEVIYSYLKDKGLNTYSYNKFIPEEYLFGSIEQRKQLLYGLMDTDGCVEDKNRYSFSTTSERLADDFIYLCRSLGYIANKNIDSRSHKYTKGICFDISILTSDIIFSSEKHLSRYHSNLKKYANKAFERNNNNNVRISSIKKVDTCESLCIHVVDSDHLYVTDDFIVTHNTFASVLAVAEPILDPNFRAIYVRKNLTDLKTAGGIIDTFKEAFGNIASIKQADTPRVTFPCGSWIEGRHLADENPTKLKETWRGVQVDALFFDEMTGFQWETFKYLLSRNRGMAKWSNKIRATLNPKKSHWTRTWLDWYIGYDGFIDPEKDGKVRYFYVGGEGRVDDVVWGNSKEEVYNLCRREIDKTLKRLGGDLRWQDMIKSFVFYEGKLSSNKIMLSNNAGYIGSVAATGGKTAQQLIEGNFNVDDEEEDDMPFPSAVVKNVFENEPMTNGSMWITCDLADLGDDNFVAFVWNGLHVVDVRIMQKSTTNMNIDALRELAMIYNIGENHIIYDATNAAYVYSAMPDAIRYMSSKASMGHEMYSGANLKDCCALRLEKIIKSEMLSFDPRVASMRYIHSTNKENLSISQEFIEECSVVRFKILPTGRKRLFGKKDMNASLGKGRSMDVFDPILMRMMPLLEFKHGDELSATAEFREEKKRTNYWDDEFNEFAGDPDNSYLYSQSI